jgi:hypothetical protein
MERHSCSMPCLTKARRQTLPNVACCAPHLIFEHGDKPCVCRKPKSVIVRMSRNRRRSSASGGLIKTRTSHMEKSDVLEKPANAKAR